MKNHRSILIYLFIYCRIHAVIILSIFTLWSIEICYDSSKALKHFHIYQFIKKHILSSWFEHDKLRSKIEKIHYQNRFLDWSKQYRKWKWWIKRRTSSKSNHESDKSFDAAEIRLCDFTNRIQSIWTKTKANRTS